MWKNLGKLLDGCIISPHILFDQKRPRNAITPPNCRPQRPPMRLCRLNAVCVRQRCCPPGMFGIAFALRRLPGVICALRRLGNRILASGLPAAALAFAPEALAQDACSDKGYTHTPNPSGIGVICPVLTRDVSARADHNTCVLGSSRPPGEILCLDAFGSDANIPQNRPRGLSKICL